MVKLFLLFMLLIACALTVVPQSGRRATMPRSTPAPPVQPSINSQPELDPEPKRAVMAPAPLNFLPERLREREIDAIDEGKFRLADFQGKVLVINLWASWCGPCRMEIPEYEKVRKDYEGRNVEFIALTTENPHTSSARVKKFLREHNFNFRLGWADRETALALMAGEQGIPQTLVIDADARVVRHWSGYAPRRSGDRLRETIDHALQLGVVSSSTQ